MRSTQRNRSLESWLFTEVGRVACEKKEGHFKEKEMAYLKVMRQGGVTTLSKATGPGLSRGKWHDMRLGTEGKSSGAPVKGVLPGVSCHCSFGTPSSDTVLPHTLQVGQDWFAPSVLDV